MFLSCLIILSLSYKLEVIRGKFEFESYATTLGFVPHTIKGYQENVEGVIIYEGEIKGEITIRELLNHYFKNGNYIKDIRDIEGIYIRKDDKVFFTGERKLVEDLDSIPFPARELVDFEPY